MQKPVTMLLIALVVLLGRAGGARAATSVHVIETDPSGDTVTLGRNQNFYLRIGYHTDQPVGIWTEPYFQGQPAHAGSNPSATYSGDGEALGWFFLMNPGDQVDEVRIRVGDGSTNGTQVLASYPVQVTAGDQSAAAHTEPTWVVEMNKQNAAAQRAAYEQRMNTPPTAGSMLLFSGFMLAMCVIGLLGFAAPAWGLWRWRGGWRLAAVVPAAMMAFVVLRVMIDTAVDPTSHNLWPFEILQTGLLSVAVMLGLLIAQKIAGARR